ncbi:LysR family transcriptional regulator [Adlercreutzia sp.]|uniref:LysR family transcriptional regulator n=1 Tax=Adlercreutzia sp. TaxID=1872387 RepID=UPI003AEF6BB1
MLDFRVKTFLTVCRTLNYTRAAEELSLTQPAVTQQIANLERSYGVKLFSYRHRKLSLTAAGRIAYQGLSAIAHDEELLRHKMSASTSGSAIPLRIGMTLTAGEYLVAAPLGRYLREHPEISVTVRSGGTRAVLDMLDANEIDCAFTEGFFDKSSYLWQNLCTERFVAVCAGNHRFAREPRRLEDLLGETLILREAGSGSREVLVHALAARNLSTDAFAGTCTVESLDIIKIFVAEDLGISFVYEAAVEQECVDGSLRVVELPDTPMSHDVCFVRLKGSLHEKEMNELFRAVSRQRLSA